MAQSIDTLCVALDYLRTQGADMPLSQLRVFLEIARHPGDNIQAITDRVPDAYSTVTRGISGLARWGRANRQGLDWVFTEDDPEFRRRKVVDLTKKGKTIAARVANLLEKGA